MSKVIKGKCLCGAISFTAKGPFSDVGVCHCSQCARWTGGVFATMVIDRNNLKLEGEQHLSWFHASSFARRGFCKTCGSSLFWERMGSGKIDIMMGALTPPTGLKIDKHIYVADKSDYYDICDGKPQYAQNSNDQ